MQNFAAQCDEYYAKDFTYEPWLDYREDGQIFVTRDYHLKGARLMTIFSGSEYIGIQNGWTVQAHWPLAPDAERCYKSTSAEPYGAHVFRFAYKDGTVKYIGINVVDGRFMVLEPPANYVPPSLAVSSSSGGNSDNPGNPEKGCWPVDSSYYNPLNKRGTGEQTYQDPQTWQDNPGHATDARTEGDPGSGGGGGQDSGGGGTIPSDNPTDVHGDEGHGGHNDGRLE